ncbi:MAG TPA: Spy/CpxP family protein refolding chaperone [Bryobacteraceae bacterium]|jgi:Spy/CpxP family protein refolding chaperone|nr:Spy/CpxP family protein refolding chaperone [Bryobacteraceae bacterium]
MKRRKIWQFGTAALLAAGMLFAQDNPGFSQRPEGQGQAHKHAGRMNPMGRLAADLNLTDAQKAQAGQIFQASRQEARPIAHQLRQYRQDLATAVKAGAPETQIDEVTAKIGPLLSQMASIRAKAFAKFYATLTPDQQQKLGTRMDRFLGGAMNRPAADHPAARNSWRRTQQ